MKCKYGYCRLKAHYVVANPSKGLQDQVDREQFYCLIHARETFKTDSITFKEGVVTVYNVVHMWSNKQS